MKKIILVIQVLALMAVLGCKKKEMPVAASILENKQAMQAAPNMDNNTVEEYIPPQTQYNDVAMCPVSGDKLSIGKETKGVKYKGKVFYTCCPACLEQFKANPEKYLK